MELQFNDISLCQSVELRGSTLQKPRTVFEETGECPRNVEDFSGIRQNPENPMIFTPQNPQESPGVPWNPQKSSEIPRNPKESPVNPQES